MKILIILIMTFCFICPPKGKISQNDSLTTLKVPTNNINDSILEELSHYVVKKVDTISFDSLIVINHQLDSIIEKSVDYLTKKSIYFGYIAMATNKNNDVYIEIIGYLNNYSIFEFNEKGVSKNNLLTPGARIFGYLRRKNKYFYIMSPYPTPYDISIYNFRKLFQTTNYKKIIYKDGEEDDDIINCSYPPSWLYIYSNGKIRLISKRIEP